MIILGIDTSCDDTSIALLKDGEEILSNIVSSQVDIHKLFGGVVPEIASRKHIELIDIIFRNAMEEANITAKDIDIICVTSGPGLIGSVLAGLCFAKGLSLSLDKPLIAVNHVEAHAMSIFLEKEAYFPYIALVVSGGHTIILMLEDYCIYKVIGSTRDDAAGEAFDKIAKYLGMGYPGGKAIEDISKKGNREYVQFPRPMIDSNDYDFSFSGLKTSFLNYAKKGGITDENISDVLASFQEAICDVLSHKAIKAAKDFNIKRIILGGGVAANNRLREIFIEKGEKEQFDVMFSSPHLCTDNGAMVAITGYHYFERGITSELDTKAFSRMKMF
ncbi:MAG: tRNA (adenosine(37)-N6)-threonylcarbamoyltransferase complex transferase subunit TsaD [Proteobacteria bacterium]|nr:tRNA (adenosine(37)-N6)-threonylcarbamoyltransferase complex transferase subunit TsaD [Pseudomonadota bacterium]